MGRVVCFCVRLPTVDLVVDARFVVDVFFRVDAALDFVVVLDLPERAELFFWIGVFLLVCRVAISSPHC